MTTILVGTILALVVARRDVENHRLKREATRQQVASEHPAGAGLEVLAQQVQELKSEVEGENLAEEVLENRWFEWLGIIGTGIVASSFYAEAIIRRSKSA